MTRVIAGSSKGRRLQVPSGTTTRPTSDRAREGLFSSLLSLLEVEGARVIDLYAGSGALGLEALSRGATSATLVESEPEAVASLRANAELLRLPGTHVVAQPVERFLEVDPEPRYDLALLDPPYDLVVEPVLEQLLPWLADDAVVVVERRTRGADLVWPVGLERVRERRYGEATLWYAVREPDTDTVLRAAPPADRPSP
jgi:16S rRNA (guanine966-N2)-methyltransferase